MVYVKVVDGNYEKALRIFKKKVKDSGLLHELQENRFYKCILWSVLDHALAL